MRYRIEQLSGSIKQKIGSSFKLLREDLARKASIACAILWNFWVLATYLFLLFLSGILHYSYAKGCGRFLEQPHGFVFLEQFYNLRDPFRSDFKVPEPGRTFYINASYTFRINSWGRGLSIMVRT